MTLRITTSSESSGWIFHAGEFWNVGPSSSTRLHSLIVIMFGRPASSVPGVIAACEGYQVSPALLSTPPDATSAAHCGGVIFDFFTGRHASPDPSITPWPVIAIFERPVAVIGETARARGSDAPLAGA